MAELVERIVTTDIYSWLDAPTSKTNGKPLHRSAVKGELIEVTAEEAERGDDLGALAVESDLAEPTTETPWEEDPQQWGLVPTTGDGRYISADEGRTTVTVAAGSQGGTVSDEDLAGMTAEELVAYANQHPEEHDRLLEAEEARATPRVTVLRALGAEE